LNIGLHVAQGIRPGVYGALDYAVRTCETLGERLRLLSRFHRFLHDIAETRVRVERDRAILSHYLPLPGGAPRPVSECVLAGWLLTSRQATGVNWIPLEARFPHPAPDDISEHQQLFACKLQFGCERSELVFARELLDAPLVKADPTLQAILEAQVVAVIEKLPKGEATTDAVRRHLAGELGKGQPTLEQIAPRLHMSPRTLCRRLEEEGTSFREILSQVRRELASRHLMERRLAIGEIAFLLGFSEPSAFHRAFKRWTGQAPLSYRELALPRGTGGVS
jgi:AraC-like DNA-binding protein